MKKIFILLTLLLVNTLLSEEKLFIIERETNSVAVIKNEKKVSRMNDMGNTNHSLIKFDGDKGFIISRDGYIIKFDNNTEKIEARYKTSNSAIGFTIGKKYVAVANYDDTSVDILDKDLNLIKKIQTGSRNVGIKIYKNYLVFAQMDSDTLSVYEDITKGEKLPDFRLVKNFKNIGIMPFDAMIKDNKYIVGFFKSSFFGTIDLDTMTYKKVQIYLADRKLVLKVPHFGLWSISNSKVFVPAVGDNKVLVYDLDFNFVKNIEIEGLPVFTSLSPNQRYLAVTHSGDKFPVVQIIDTQELKVIKRFEFKGKVLHLRWSKQTPNLYISVNDTNYVAVVDSKSWNVVNQIENIEKPSGIFLYEIKEK
ncbi:cytochrome D1 domain-containing protein [Halarcobacter bivalviorum]|uniref:Cytochrome d1 heme domain protein, putative heme d1 dehydrogenase NirF n=1 Tax=Halarcobacter bivalviorum TaxID=663364 RepID=A0AAX2AAR6_9BACT|nr:cytochrome D1 domain-containing protein [Halarcobacter bivalviorum]AXH12668.1 cytochrome d1 heme domain protein, putative heme d1 dehydrogenase NirF [Halarcobacter bivalviorum]RXK10408.1 nitrite reductase [Halarcobacter bivalviorum]